MSCYDNCVLIFFILADFFWFLAALLYDADKLLTLSPLLWLFVAVCPLYPLLLALVLLQLYLKKLPNQFLLGFAAIHSAVYGVLAILYYPLAMYHQGFSWNAFGQIFWVLFYALQGLWLLLNYKINREVFILAGAILVLKLIIIDFYFKSFGYFDFTGIPNYVLISLLFITVILLGMFYKIRK